MGRARKTARTCKACGGLAKGHPGPTGYRLCQVAKNRNEEERRRSKSSVKSKSKSRSRSKSTRRERSSSKDSQVSANSSLLTSKYSEKNTVRKENSGRSSSRSSDSSRTNSTVNKPDYLNNDDECTPKTKILKELSKRVSDMQIQIDDMVSRDGSASLVEVGRSTPKPMVAVPASPIPAVGQSSQTAVDFLMKVQDDNGMVAAAAPAALAAPASRRRVEGLKPVPNGLDISTIKSAQGWSENTAKRAIRGEFINLSTITDEMELIQEEENYELVQNNGAFSFRQKVQKKCITDYLSWSEAWLKYEKLMSEYHGIELYLRIVDYKSKILDFSKVYIWEAVQLFDNRHRRDMYQAGSIDLCNLTQNNVTTILNASVLKIANQCQKCKSTAHATIECTSAGTGKNNQPFQKASGVSAGRRHSNANSHNSQDNTCYYFNNTRCTHQNCKRKHLCSGCRGDAPYSVCSRYGNCSRYQSTNQRY